jgi:hypothetical protein
LKTRMTIRTMRSQINARYINLEESRPEGANDRCFFHGYLGYHENRLCKKNRLFFNSLFRILIGYSLTPPIVRPCTK